MRKIRTVLVTGFALGVLASAAFPARVLAATDGVGTASASTSLLKVSLGTAGSVLQARVLGDDSRSTIDPSVANPSASSTLVPLDVTSVVAPGLSVKLPAVESKSTGAQDVKSSPVIDLTTAATGGSINPFSLVSIVDTAGARSGFDTTATNLTVVGGLLSVPSAVSSLNTKASPTASTGTRGIEVPAVTVLDLSALLDGLGIDLADLPLETVVALLNQLGVQVPDIGSGADVAATVDELNAAIDDVQELVTDGGATVDDVLALLDPLAPIVDTQPVEDLADDAVAAANAAVDELQQTLADVLDAALAALDGAALLTASGIEVGLDATAVDTAGNSSAVVAAKIGGLSVGNIQLPGIDLLKTADQVNALANSVTGTVGSTLAVVHPGLADIVKLTLFDRSTDVKGDAARVTSSASMAALVVAVKPPVDVTALVEQVKSTTGVGDLLETLGAASAGDGEVAAAAVGDVTAMGTLEQALGGVQALAGGAEIRVLDMSATSTFAPRGGVAVPSSGPELPRTGGDTLPIAMFGIVALGGSLVLLRWLRTPTTSTTR